MPNGQKNVYEVYEDGNLFEKGTGAYIAERMHISVHTIKTSLERGSKIHGLYEIKKVGFVSQKFEMTTEQIMDYLYRHLRKYGNTCLNDDPTQFIPELQKKIGGEIWIRKVIEKDDPFNYEVDEFNQGKYKRGRSKYFYVLEVL